MFRAWYNVFMDIFSNRSKSNKNSNQARKGAAFSITMPFEVEHRLREIQRSMGLNSRSQTVVFLVHSYDKEIRTFNSLDKLALLVEKIEKMENLRNKDYANMAQDIKMDYNNTN